MTWTNSSSASGKWQKRFSPLSVTQTLLLFRIQNHFNIETTKSTSVLRDLMLDWTGRPFVFPGKMMKIYDSLFYRNPCGLYFTPVVYVNSQGNTFRCGWFQCVYCYRTTGAVTVVLLAKKKPLCDMKDSLSSPVPKTHFQNRKSLVAIIKNIKVDFTGTHAANRKVKVCQQ